MNLKIGLQHIIFGSITEKNFLKNTSIKRIFIPCWYFPDAMGLIAASKKFNILTYDMQHGIQGKYRPMYTDWCKIGKKDMNCFQIFLAAGIVIQKNILNSSKNRKNICQLS